MLLGLQTSRESGHALKQMVTLRQAKIMTAQSPVYLSGCPEFAVSKEDINS